MPKLGMQPIRRRELIVAAVEAIHERGLNGVTLPYLAYPKVETPDGLFDHKAGNRLSYQINASRSEG